MKKHISHLYEKNNSFKFYEDRYKNGYMDEWSIEQKIKIFEAIQELKLPENGDALDFGCGNGVLTEIIRQALPGWNIYGTDLSIEAITNAKFRYSGCTFFNSDTVYAHKKFDFLFTNHVLEHVFDLSEVFNQIDGYLKPNSSMVHFLPSGNRRVSR